MSIRIDDPHADALIEIVRVRRGSKSKTRTAIEMIKERAIAMGIDIGAVDLQPPPSSTPNAPCNGRAGAAFNSRPKGGRPCTRSA